MKKVALIGLLSAGVMAADHYDYAGIHFGELKSEFSAHSGSGTAHGDMKDSAYSLALGHYYGEQGRVSAMFTYADAEDYVDRSHVLSVSYDFLLPLVERSLAVFAGPSVGYTWLELEDGSDFNGIHYGGQAGVIIRLPNGVDLEGGYRYLVESGEMSDGGGKIELDNTSMWYIGANIRF